MKIIINENQVKFLTEDLNSLENVSYGLKESIALWCLINDFKYVMEDSVFGKKINVANDDNINKEICQDIMNGKITVSNENKELFGYNDYDDFEDGDDEREEFMNGNTIYKVETNDETYFIEVSNEITEYYGENLLQEYADGEINDRLIKWFYNIYR